MNKIVIIINGRGGVGKDTLCDAAAKYYAVENISSITPIKELAKLCGWDGEKDDKSRKFLSDLKQLLMEYNDYPNQYLVDRYHDFLNSDKEIMFVHIRECQEIEKFKASIQIPCVTLLVERFNGTVTHWGNASDDEVENYKYDYIFDNNESLEVSEKKFIVFLRNILQEYWKVCQDGIYLL